MLLSEARCPRLEPDPGTVVALLGPGRVGGALLKRFRHQSDSPRLVAIANSCEMLLGRNLGEQDWLNDGDSDRTETSLNRMVAWLQQFDGANAVVIDATASREVARHHAEWLKQGLAVVTANKWALAAEENYWHALNDLWQQDRSRYLASATVGAGLPALPTLLRLRQAGETIHAVSGALSGTMTFLCRRVGAGISPSEALAEAIDAGLAEPDPRHDLDGLDVARKLVILARASGYRLSLNEIQVTSLVPPRLRQVPLPEFLAARDEFDAFWQDCVDQAQGQGGQIALVGCFKAEESARVGMQRIDTDHPLSTLSGAANLIEIRTDCYRAAPLWVAGPGAGIEVTALALWSDLLQSANARYSPAEIEQAVGRGQ